VSEKIVLHGFGFNDRSGKVRWLAHELGLEVEERRLELGAHRREPYLSVNPYGAVPAVEWRGEALIESTAICTLLGEQHPAAGLVVMPGEVARGEYLQWMAVCSDSLESKLVEYYLAGAGILPAGNRDLHHATLERKLAVFVSRLPSSGYLVAQRFTLADLTAAYSLRLAISSGLVERGAVEGYLRPLMDRPAARSARFFASIEGG